MKQIIVVFFFLIVSTSVFAQQFEGELIYEIHDSTGKVIPMKIYGRDNHARMKGEIAGTMVDIYVTPDSMAMVFPQLGFMLGKDSAIAFFQFSSQDKAGPDSLIHIIPTSQTKVISGFRCTCMDVDYRSGKKKEYWVTSEVDTDICMMFYRSSWLNLWGPADGTAQFTLNLNKSGKLIISTSEMNKNNVMVSESILRKVARRPIADDEVLIPPTVTLWRVNPQFFKNAVAAEAKKKESEQQK